MQSEEYQAMPPNGVDTPPNNTVAAPPPNDPAQKLEELAGEIGRMRQATNRANLETAADLGRLEAELQELELELKARKRTGAAQWLTLAILAAALIGACWYGYPVLKRHASVIAKIPESFHSLGKRIDSTEEQLRAWANDRDVLTGRLAKLETRVTANLHLVRKESREMANQVGQRLQAELDRRMEQVTARLNRVESNQAAEQARLEQLQNEVGDLRKPAAQEMPIPQNIKDGSGGVADVNLAADSNKLAADGLSKHIGSARMDFAATKDQTQELAPGISLTVTHTNPGYQNVDGWLKLLPEGEILRVRGQDIGQPVSFYTQQSKKPYELVFTRITKGAVTGYLLVPAQNAGNGALISDKTEEAYSASP